jgi:C4-dicarboxylate-specific signal transduction histidine kinase
MFNVALLIQSVSLLVAETNFDIHSKNVNVYADENQLQQVLVNLIKNAVEAMQGDRKVK